MNTKSCAGDKSQSNHLRKHLYMMIILYRRKNKSIPVESRKVQNLSGYYSLHCNLKDNEKFEDDCLFVQLNV